MQVEDKLPQTAIDLIESLGIPHENNMNCCALTQALYLDLNGAPAIMLQFYLNEAIENFHDDVDKDINKFFPIVKS